MSSKSDQLFLKFCVFFCNVSRHYLFSNCWGRWSIVFNVFKIAESLEDISSNVVFRCKLKHNISKNIPSDEPMTRNSGFILKLLSVFIRAVFVKLHLSEHRLAQPKLSFTAEVKYADKDIS